MISKQDSKKHSDSVPVSHAGLLALVAYHLLATTVTHFHKAIGAGVYLVGLVIFMRPLTKLLDKYLVGSWLILNDEASKAREEDSPNAFDYRPLVVLCTAAVSLTLIEYFGSRNSIDAVVRFGREFLGGYYKELVPLAYWSMARVIGYIIIPWLVVFVLPGERLRDYGLSVRGFTKHLWIYGILYLIVLPVLVMVSYTTAFQHTYPFYKMAARSWTDFFLWECFYGIQFFALEVFFRGFMIHPLKKPLGAYSIFVMALPYCMIHYNKPLAEVLGAVVAGIVLGTLSLRTGSIWCGVLVHVSVAVSMDILAMIQTTGFIRF